ESADTFFLNLSNATGALIADAQGVATIANDDPLPSVSVSDALVVEGNSGTRNESFTLTLSQASGQSVVVTYNTADGTATAAGGPTGAAPPPPGGRHPGPGR